MNQLIKINRGDYRKIKFASDFHYNHQRDFIWKPRGFETYHEHDKFIETECDKLSEDDLLIYLGDFSLNSTDDQTWGLLRRIKCPIYYIFGNHESCMERIYKQALKDKLNMCIDEVDEPLYDENRRFKVFPLSVEKNFVYPGFGDYIKNKIWAPQNKPLVFLGDEATFQIGNHFYYCRHMAPAIWDRMKYENQVALCGHSHGNFKGINPDARIGKILDVGVDNAMYINGTCFFDVEEVNSIMKNKEIKIHDHHGE